MFHSILEKLVEVPSPDKVIKIYIPWNSVRWSIFYHYPPVKCMSNYLLDLLPVFHSGAQGGTHNIPIFFPQE